MSFRSSQQLAIVRRAIFVPVAFLATCQTIPSAFCQVLPFQQYTMNDGLVSNGVSVLLQDSRGFLWIGTADGVSVYDGYEFKNYNESGGHTLGLITSLTESKASPGTIWIGSLGTGLNRFTNNHVVLAPNPRFQPGGIVAMIEDDSGALWCGTERGLYVIDTAVGSAPVKLLDGYIPDVVKSKDGRVWVATADNVDIFSQQRERVATTHLKAYLTSHADQLLASSDGSVWIATDRGTVLQFRDTVLLQSRSCQGDRIRAMNEDSHGNLWLCTEQGQLIKLSKDNPNEMPESITTKNGLAGKALTTLIDREDNVWVGLLGHGLQKLAYRNIAVFPTEPLPLGYAYQPPLCSDSSGRFWAIAIDGLHELFRDSTGRWTLARRMLHELGLTARPGSVRFGPKGNMWVGTVEGTIHEFKVEQSDFRRSKIRGVREFRPSIHPSRSKLKIFTLDRDGNIWCNFLDTAVVVFDKTFTNIRVLTESDGLPSRDITVMFLDKDDVMWIGGVGKGVASIAVSEIRSGKLRTLKSADGLPDEAIRAIYQDAWGRVIFGTKFGGLALYDKGVFSSLNTTGGLSNNCVWSISGDGTDHIWICTQVGLQRVNLRTLRPEFPRKALASDQTICCNVNGGTVVAWRYGSLVVYESNKAAIDNIRAPIYVTQLEVNAQPVTISNPLTFSHDLNACTIGFVGISFREENGLRYRYRLLGLDPEWSLPTSQRAVTFAQLPPGAYTFEVQAFSGDHVSSIHPASIAFTILPPFWRTWWAYVTYVLVVLVSGVALRRYEIKRIRRKEHQEAAIREAELRAEMAEQQKELEKQQTRVQIARDLHDEVGSTLSSITFFAQAMRESQSGQPDGSNKFLTLITESSSHAKEAMSDIIWSINPANDNWENISSKFRRYASDTFESKGITHSIDMPDAGTGAIIDPERRRHLWLLFKEIVTNIAKHSRCNEANIRLMAQDGHLTLDVTDNGIGFNREHRTAGHGLKNIEARGKALAATVDLQTSPETGTRWRISFHL